MSRGHHKADKRLRSENPAAILGRKGGQTRAKKYGKQQLKEWGKLGGRPKKKEPASERTDFIFARAAKAIKRDRRKCACRGIPNQVCDVCQKSDPNAKDNVYCHACSDLADTEVFHQPPVCREFAGE